MYRQGTRGKPLSDQHRDVLAERARQQHARKRGFAIRPEAFAEYSLAYHRLRYAGKTREQALAELRPIYAVEAAP